MRLLHTEITPLINGFLSIDLRRQQFLQSPFHSQPSFHAHPELELVFVIEGYGTRIIGNKAEPFESGDMVFIGPNVPHVWLSDEAFYKKNTKLRSRVVVTYFNPKIFEEVFNSVKEFSSIRYLIRQASKGIKIFGETRRVIAEKLIALSSKSGFEKIEGLLQIMHLISTSQHKSFIVNKEIEGPGSHYSDRLIDVIKFIKDNLHNQVSLKQVAAIACMTEQSFCRFFRSRTKKASLNISATSGYPMPAVCLSKRINPFPKSPSAAATGRARIFARYLKTSSVKVHINIKRALCRTKIGNKAAAY
ncbi:MAG TPA: cupin domain-containing protein [Flavitalea sp.]|nr:cupin domain-containing protein [Flavitalea sp.]